MRAHGFGLRHTQVTITAHQDCFIVTLALILLTGLGLVARRRFAPQNSGSSNEHEYRDVTVGR